MIISASRRTDIPALYGPWLLNRARQGHCLKVNPFNPSQTKQVSLRPQDVTAMVLWTKNPRPFVHGLEALQDMGLRLLMLHTLNGYPRMLEPGVPPLARRLDTFAGVSRLLGPDKLRWRYDPILIGDATPPKHHVRSFSRICRELNGMTRHVIVSWYTPYAKAEKRLAGLNRARGIRIWDSGRQTLSMRELAPELAAIAGDNGMAITSCAMGEDLDGTGVAPGPCIDPDWIREAFDLEVPRTKDPGQRNKCRCVPSEDIGAYDTCVLGCAYCYGTSSRRAALRAKKNHDPVGPGLHPRAQEARTTLPLLDIT
ncbi:MAG: DUF1848 domain-containing protein [Desulfovibrio sp.]|nr:MAG: DUF1848 domain-containing protein [Desulfovibrio sp.]